MEENFNRTSTGLLQSDRDSHRAGVYVRQPTGYKAFIPHSLTDQDPIRLSSELVMLLSSADRAIGRLDAATELLPNPDLFVAMYVRREAVYSSQIEGTQASLTDLLEYEVEALRSGRFPDVQEVVNYIKAMNHGLSRLDSLPLSLRLIREIHKKLLEGVRGQEREPGRFRRTQNWLGPQGCSLSEAIFVPPPPQEVMRCMGILESYIHLEAPVPPLVKCALVHAQFETIHPFLDGNGRVGRLLITFQLCWQKILKRPLLYISDYFKRHQTDYYARLQRVRDFGDWEGWVTFFLEGVREVALQATETARTIQDLRVRHRELVAEEVPGTPNGLILIDHLFNRPMINIKQVAEVTKRSYPVANALVSRFEELGLLHEITGGQRNRIYAYRPYLALFE